jgi:molybdate transport system substrate-binding protein
MRRAFPTLLAALLPAVFWGCSPGPEKPAVRVAAAADLKFALEDLLGEFRRAHPGVGVEVSYGSSGNFFAQLSNRAPFDLFLSADADYPRRLAEEGLAAKEDVFTYAVGHLVVWVPRAGPDVEKEGVRVLLDPAVRKVAIANPRHAPYGRAAEAALRSLGLYDRVKERLVLGENIAQAAQFVQTGSADAGVLALSLALAPGLREHGRYRELPPEAYPRLDQAGVILSWARDRGAAEEVRAFLTGAGGQAVLRRYGFSPPE